MYSIYRKLIVSLTQKPVWSHRLIKRTLPKTKNTASKHQNPLVAYRAYCKRLFRRKLQPSHQSSVHWVVPHQADPADSVWAAVLVLVLPQAKMATQMTWVRMVYRAAVLQADHQPVLVDCCHHSWNYRDQFCHHHPNRQLLVGQHLPVLTTIATNKQRN